MALFSVLSNMLPDDTKSCKQTLHDDVKEATVLKSGSYWSSMTTSISHSGILVSLVALLGNWLNNQCGRQTAGDQWYYIFVYYSLASLKKVQPKPQRWCKVNTMFIIFHYFLLCHQKTCLLSVYILVSLICRLSQHSLNQKKKIKPARATVTLKISKKISHQSCGRPPDPNIFQTAELEKFLPLYNVPRN